MSCASLTWRIGGEDVPCPTVAQLLALRPGDFAVLKPPPSKADQFGMRWGSKPIWLPFDAGARICAAAALAR